MKKIFIGMILVFIFTGCTAETRYKVLSFFFDGVPMPGQKNVTAKHGRKKYRARKLRVFLHGPYAARMCNACHELGFSNKLILPKDRLCYHCHTFNTKGMWVHGPVAAGGCLLCHDPHSSRYKYMLVGKAEEFCFYCHQKERVLSSAYHVNALKKGCTGCHNAHMSARRFMLREDVPYSDTKEGEEKTKPK